MQLLIFINNIGNFYYGHLCYSIVVVMLFELEVYPEGVGKKFL
jgi:hypothetical protein